MAGYTGRNILIVVDNSPVRIQTRILVALLWGCHEQHRFMKRRNLRIGIVWATNCPRSEACHCAICRTVSRQLSGQL